MTIKNDQHGLPVQASRPALCQNITTSGASQQSAAFQSGPITNVYNADGTLQTEPNNTTHIRVVAAQTCWISFGTNPTAAVGGTASILLPAGIPEYFYVNRGEKLAVIQDSAAGTLNIAELAN